MNVANVEVLVRQFHFIISNKGGVANWQLTALVMATMAYWQHLTPHHMPRSDADRPMQKGAQRRMFCCAPFVRSLRRVWWDGAQGLVGWCAGMVWERVGDGADGCKNASGLCCG